jgi:hypothetical protein
MGFFKTLDADKVQAIWAKFDIALITEFKAANESMSKEDTDEAIRDGKLTLVYQEDLGLAELSEEDQIAKSRESQEYLVTNFGTQEDIQAFEAWKAAN